MAENIRELYEIYGFEKVEEREGMITFAYKFGFFTNAEIVVTDSGIPEEEIEEVKRDYQNAGYGVRVFKSNDYDEIHMHLFQSFFRISQNRARLEEDYTAFCERQSKSLHNEYKYIEGQDPDNRYAEGGFVSCLLNAMAVENPCLSISEAAAGYGKTCTVYEIIKERLLRDEKNLPLFIELSKNRNARIFKYVLQSEIDQKFSHLSYELVMFEITNGFIPLVIDGFDELIESSGKKKKISDDPDEQSVTMLTTISDMLGKSSKAKIILTSRRCAMFTGDIFDEWVGSRISKNCIVERYQIPVPNIIAWIGKEKYQLLNTDKNIANLNNPVMLAFIANNITVRELKNGSVRWDDLLEKFFRLILERERERQDLLLDYEEIYDIMVGLAAEFARYDITSEQIEFIQELLEGLVENNLLDYRERYKRAHFKESGMLTKEEYIRRLSHNSLLDRHVSKNSISFLNEFILGILVGDALCDGKLDVDEITERYADIVITAYATRSEDTKKALYRKIAKGLPRWDALLRVKAGIKLIYAVKGVYLEQDIYGLDFRGDILKDSRFEACLFEACSFSDCSIDTGIFRQCFFVNCKFFNVEAKSSFDSGTVFIGCRGAEDFVINQEPVDYEAVDESEKLVLEQFWKPGASGPEPRRTYSALFKGIPSDRLADAKDAIQSLKSKGIINEYKVGYGLNYSRINDIERILRIRK